MAWMRRNWVLAAALVLAALRGPAAAAQDAGRPPADPAPPDAPGSPYQQRPATASGTAGWAVFAEAPPAAPVLPAPRPLGGPGAAEAAPTAPAPPGCEAPPARPLPFCERILYRLQDCFLGYRDEFQSPPLGYTIHQHFKTEVANGDAARMVFYEYDFEDGGAALNLHGRDKLARVAALLSRNFCPVVIERTPCIPALAEARRLAVLGELAHGPFPVPPERVVIGLPIANGLSGTEAELVYQNLLSQTRRQGVSAGGSTGGPAGQSSGASGSTGTPMGAAGTAP
jgi:hypothetical protein